MDSKALYEVKRQDAQLSKQISSISSSYPALELLGPQLSEPVDSSQDQSKSGPQAPQLSMADAANDCSEAATKDLNGPEVMESTVKMLITYVQSPAVVYAQFVDDSAPLVWTKNDLPLVKSQFKQKPHLLDIVLALYNDGCYYRAQIMEELDRAYKIFYVDYGNTEFVPLDALVPCGDEDRMRPHRAVRCYLEGVTQKRNLSFKGFVGCVEYLKSKILDVAPDLVLVNRLQDGCVIRFLGEFAELPVQLMERGYAQPAEDISGSYDSDVDQ